MYLKFFKDKLKHIHLKVNPNYKLFKLFGILWDDLQNEFDKVYNYINLKIEELREYINQKIAEIKNYIDNEILKVNTRIDNLEPLAIPTLAKNMVATYSDIVNISENETINININYPSGYGIGDTVALSISVIKPIGIARLFDISYVCDNYKLEFDDNNINLNFTNTSGLTFENCQIMIIVSSIEDKN